MKKGGGEGQDIGGFVDFSIFEIMHGDFFVAAQPKVDVVDRGQI